MAAQTSTTAPLLGNLRDARPANHNATSTAPAEDHADFDASDSIRRRSRRFLSSHNKHYLVMGIVALDVMALLANIVIKWMACEMHQSHEPWVINTTKSLEALGLIFSCLFMLELAACLFAFGFSYLKTWFHLFDSAVIVLSFVIDVGSQGLAESIGSLVVVLRFWRLAKISEEVVMGATERMEILEQQLGELESENKHLRAQLELPSHDHSGHEQC